ncbi:hypothetical protein [Leucobacter sp. M11]|nr:hypothetical protein [Leucobacter sp. M11]MEB4615817.1 hypothetical protein [Leucobacter sp. M11]
MSTKKTHPEDAISDPAHSAEEGRDWSDEGGATETGPASHTDEDRAEA